MTAAELDLLDDSEDEELLNEPLPDEGAGARSIGPRVRVVI